MKMMTNLLYQTVRTSRLTDAVKPPDPVRLLLQGGAAPAVVSLWRSSAFIVRTVFTRVL